MQTRNGNNYAPTRASNTMKGYQNFKIHLPRIFKIQIGIFFIYRIPYFLQIKIVPLACKLYGCFFS